MDIYKLQRFIKDVLLRIDDALNTKRIEQDCKWLKVHYKKEYDNIMNITKFLDVMNVTFSQRIWHIYHNKMYLQKCKVCDDISVSFNRFSKGYFTFCSPKCASVVGSKKRSIKYYNKSKEERDVIKKKQKTTHLSRSKSDIEKSDIKRNDTNLEKFGVENPSKLKRIIDKIKQTKKERHGDENYNNRKKYIQTCLKKFGVENPFQSEDIKDKSKQTMLKRYGTEHPFFENKYNCHDYTLPSGKKIVLQGYEPNALKILLTLYDESDILYERLDMPEILYIGEDDKQHRYYPDFYIPLDNLIVEVKSNWTYNTNLTINKLKEKATKEIGYNFKLMILEK